ncbi:MAG: hypothetical protein NZO16_01875 [Deltaproteobacteria bacterium]|nr:hypothetical protein [Deltaproteobacteria bacterium]
MIWRLYNKFVDIAGCFVSKKRTNFSFPSRQIWIHCASIGELSAAMPVIQRLESVWITVTSKNGLSALRTLNLDGSLAPLDAPKLIDKAIEQLNSRFFLLVENEFWPNLCNSIVLRGIPFAVVNLALRDAGILRRLFLNMKLNFYRQARFLQCQNDSVSDLLCRFGCDPARILPSVNLKIAREAKINQKFDEFLQELTVRFQRVITLASFRLREAKVLIPVLAKLLGEFSDLCCVVIPRYLEETREVKKLVSTHISSSVIYPSDNFNFKGLSSRLIIVNQFGLVQTAVKNSWFYLVGGTFCRGIGGHNPVEGAFCGVPGIAGWDDGKILDMRGLYYSITEPSKIYACLRRFLLDRFCLREVSQNLINARKKAEEVVTKIVSEVKKIV